MMPRVGRKMGRGDARAHQGVCRYGCEIPQYTNWTVAASPPLVDRIWLWVYYHKIRMYLIFYLLQGDYMCCSEQRRCLHGSARPQKAHELSKVL